MHEGCVVVIAHVRGRSLDEVSHGGIASVFARERERGVGSVCACLEKDLDDVHMPLGGCDAQRIVLRAPDIREVHARYEGVDDVRVSFVTGGVQERDDSPSSGKIIVLDVVDEGGRNAPEEFGSDDRRPWMPRRVLPDLVRRPHPDPRLQGFIRPDRF